MSMTAQFANQHGSEEDKASDAGDTKVHRLLDILTQEVSLVNRAANRQRWLVRKGSEEMLEVTENSDGTLTSQPATAPEASAETVVDKAPEGVGAGDDGADAVEKQVALPAAVKQALLEACKSIKTRLDDLKLKLRAAQESEEAEEPTAVLMEMKNLAMMVGGLMSKYPSPVAGGKGSKDTERKADDDSPKSDAEVAGVGKADYVLPPGYKGKLVGAAEQAMAALSVAERVLNAAQEADAGSNPMPPEVAKPLQEAHDALMGGYGMGKGKAKKDGEAEAEKASGSSNMLKEIETTLGVVMAKLQPGKALDEDSYQRLDKLRSIVSSAMKNTKEDDQTSSSEALKADVAKAGAKMSTERRKRFQAAIKSLIDLFKEVMPSSELSKMPHLMVRKADAKPTPDPAVVELQARLAKAEEQLATSRQEVAALRAQPQASNVQQIEAPVAPKAPPQSLWPMDLNTLND